MSLTVATLRKALRHMPPDALVLADGCDCEEAARCVVLRDDDTVLVSRLAAEDIRRAGNTRLAVDGTEEPTPIPEEDL